MIQERWQRQQSIELEEGEVDKVENASATISIIIINIININIDIDIDKVENASATIRKLGLTLPVLPIQVSHLPLFT